MTNFLTDGNYHFGKYDDPLANKVVINENGLLATTTTDTFALNGLGFTYNTNSATWNDVSTKVQALKAVVTPPNITTLAVLDTVLVENTTTPTITTTVTPSQVLLTTPTNTVTLNSTSLTKNTGDYSLATTAGNLSLDVGATNNINIGTTVTNNNINIGTANARSTVLHLGDGDNVVSTGAVHINNGVSCASNTQIMNGANTTGNCNILTGASTSGNCNILTGGSSTGSCSILSGTLANGTVNILNGTGAEGSITIGKSNVLNTTDLNSHTTTVGGINMNINSTTTTVGGTTTNLNSTSTNVGGTLVSNTINTTTTTSTMNIGSNLITGSTVNIGGNSVNSGTINIMGGSLAGGTINIGNYNTTPAIRTITNLKGNNFIGSHSSSLCEVTGDFKSNNVNGVDTTGTQNLFSTKTTGTLNCLATGTGTLNVRGGGLKTDIINPLVTTSASTMVIGSLMNFGGNIEIGTGLTSTKVKGTLISDTVDATSSNVEQIIGGNLSAGGILTLGSNTATTSLKGSVYCDNIYGSTATADQSLFANKASGAITLCANQTAGSLAIGTAGLPNISIGGTASIVSLDGTVFSTNPPALSNDTTVATTSWVRANGGGGGGGNATTITVATDATNATFYPAFVSATTGNLAPKVVGDLTYNPSSNTLTATTFSGALSGNATSATTATTATSATTATTATTATNATNTTITADSTNATFYPTFVSATTGNLPQKVDTNLIYNPNTNTLSAINFEGALSGNATSATTATTATNATNTEVTADSTNANFYPTFVSATTGNIPQKVDTDLTYNPSTNTLTVPTVVSNTINATDVSSAQTIGSNVTTGTVSVASGLTATGIVNVGNTVATTNIKGNVAIETLNITDIKLTGTPPFVYLPSNKFSNFFGATDTGWVTTANVPNNSNLCFAGVNSIVAPASYFVNWYVLKSADVTNMRMRVIGSSVAQTTGTTLSGLIFENPGLIFRNTMTGANDISGMGFYQGVANRANMWLTIENTSSVNVTYVTRMIIYRVA